MRNAAKNHAGITVYIQANAIKISNVKANTMKICAFILILGFSSAASAGCWLKGKEYPVGAVVKGYVCNSDGYWRKK